MKKYLLMPPAGADSTCAGAANVAILGLELEPNIKVHFADLLMATAG